ncbi:hypothetical protein ACLEXX_02090 [Enterobacter ludwigii]|uniref:hypothetical protein n=1 Tax=Enterobacter ludwigii TaxID=299767 RepID=UPI0039768BA4
MKFLTAAVLLLPLASNASCWTVKDLKGSSYSEREGYSRIDDKFSGTFTIVIDGDNATVLYDGLNGGGMIYRAMSKNVVVGLTTEPGKHAMETWVVQPDGVVLMSKTLSGFGGMDSTKAMVGKVAGVCK